jgi:F-type H+-transporting ATPase subunit gamma
MPSLIDIRQRIRSVKNTQKITKAMKMVSAARLRRSQDRVLLARPYAHMLYELMAHAAVAAKANEVLAGHPLLAQREEKRIQLIFLTSDRGLAGSFNSNLVKAAESFVAEHPDAEIDMELIGRKGLEYFKKRGASVSGEHVELASRCVYEDVAPIGDKVMDRFANKEIDAVYIIYNEFKSVLTQNLSTFRLLPIELTEEDDLPHRYITEQKPWDLLDAFLPRYVRVMMHHALLESTAAEHAARMTAMDAATTNAGELIDKLTLYMNRVRQASITREIIEVVSGATAQDE